jgi:hypothetical protein
VYRRADLSRTFVLVVALLLTAVSTGAFAREFRPDPQNEHHPIEALQSGRTGAEARAACLNRTKFALIRTMTPVLVVHLRKAERI